MNGGCCRQWNIISDLIETFMQAYMFGIVDSFLTQTKK